MDSEFIIQQDIPNIPSITVSHKGSDFGALFLETQVLQWDQSWTPYFEEIVTKNGLSEYEKDTSSTASLNWKNNHCNRLSPTHYKRLVLAARIQRARELVFSSGTKSELQLPSVDHLTPATMSDVIGINWDSTVKVGVHPGVDDAISFKYERLSDIRGVFDPDFLKGSFEMAYYKEAAEVLRPELDRREIGIKDVIKYTDGFIPEVVLHTAMGIEMADRCLCSGDTSSKEKLAAYWYITNARLLVDEILGDMEELSVYIANRHSDRVMHQLLALRSKSLLICNVVSERDEKASGIQGITEIDTGNPIHCVLLGLDFTGVAPKVAPVLIGPGDGEDVASNTPSPGDLYARYGFRAGINSGAVSPSSVRDFGVVAKVDYSDRLPGNKREFWRVFLARNTQEMFSRYLPEPWPSLSKDIIFEKGPKEGLNWGYGDNAYDFIWYVLKFSGIEFDERQNFFLAISARFDPGQDTDILPDKVPAEMRPYLEEFEKNYGLTYRDGKLPLYYLTQIVFFEKLPEESIRNHYKMRKKVFNQLVQICMDNGV